MNGAHHLVPYKRRLVYLRLIRSGNKVFIFYPKVVMVHNRWGCYITKNKLLCLPHTRCIVVNVWLPIDTGM